MSYMREFWENLYSYIYICALTYMQICLWNDTICCIRYIWQWKILVFARWIACALIRSSSCLPQNLIISMTLQLSFNFILLLVEQFVSLLMIISHSQFCFYIWFLLFCFISFVLFELWFTVGWATFELHIPLLWVPKYRLQADVTMSSSHFTSCPLNFLKMKKNNFPSYGELCTSFVSQDVCKMIVLW